MYRRNHTTSRPAIQTNAPGYSSIMSQKTPENAPLSKMKPTGPLDFATPRPSAKTKIIHKEKLNVLSPSSTGTSGRSDGVPTAHVSPHPAVRPSMYETPSTMRRTNSADLSRLAQNSDTHSHHLISESFIARNPSTPSKRWNSFQNIASSQNEQHEALPMDPNMTIDHSRLVREAEDAYDTKTSYNGHEYIGVEPRLRHGPGGHQQSNTEHSLSGYSVQNSSIHRTSGGSTFPHSHSAKDLFTRTSDPYTKDNHTPSLGGSYTSAGQYDSKHSVYSSHSRAVPAYHGLGNTYPMSEGPSSGPPKVGGTEPYNSDLSQWQQRHLEQLHRQQLDLAHANGLHGSNAIGVLLDPHKHDAIRRLADTIIDEKDTIIRQQKVRILELERYLRDSEMGIHKSLLKKSQNEGDAMHFKLQELQYENATLKDRLTSLTTSTKDLSHLEKKLGESEYDMREFKILSEKELSSKIAEIERLKEKLSYTEGQINEWRDKCCALQASRDTLQKRLDSMDRYLGDQPTPDEHSKKAKEFQSLLEDKARYKTRISDMEHRLSEATKAVKSRDSRITSLENKEKDIKSRLEALQTENERLKSQMAADGIEPIRHEDIDELKYENSRLKSDLEKARKLLETKHKKLQQLEARYRSERVQLEERISQEEATVTALREDINTKDVHLKKLRVSIKEQGALNQDLMEKCMTKDDHIKQLERLSSGDIGKLERKLLKEMNLSFAELQSLVQVCVQHAEGQDPNLSVLLGVKASGVQDQEDDQPKAEDSLLALKHKITKVRELRHEIDRLRELISNKFAEDMGEKINCTTQ